LLEAVFKYYALDWIAIFLTFAQVYCLGNKNKLGFVFGGLSNVAWFSFGFIIGSVAVPIAHVIMLYLNSRGLYKWYSESKKDNDSEIK